MSVYNYFIDESGKPQLRNIDPAQPNFILASVLVHDDTKKALKIKADQIKFKYWGRTDVVFHGNDIRHCSGDFAIFTAPGAKFSISDFYADFLMFLNASYRIGVVSINKTNYVAVNPTLAHALGMLVTAGRRSNWKIMVNGMEKDLLKMAATELLTMYLDYMNRKKASGEVIVESADEVQDMAIYLAYNKALVSGFMPFGMSSIDVRERLTGISFVTKNNHDIESQLADISAHYFNIESRINDGLLPHPSPDDLRVITVLKSKTFNYRQTIGAGARNSFTKLH